jgi:hypothetical protein
MPSASRSRTVRATTEDFPAPRRPVTTNTVPGCELPNSLGAWKTTNLEAGLRRSLHTDVIARSRAVGATVGADTAAAGCAADLVESRLPH